MPLITQEVPGLYNGISQQNPIVRAKDQLSDLQNGWASLADGVGKRAPTEHVAKIADVNASACYIHEINRDVTERYIVVAQPGAIRVFDLQGNEKTVTAPAGWDYLSTVEDFTQDVSMTTVADYTFVVNRKAVCAMAPLGSDTAAQPGTNVWLNRAYGTTADGAQIGPGLTYQYPPNVDVAAITGVVQRFDKLPATGTEGQVYQVKGDDSTSFVSYYVRYSGGVWDECQAPGLVNAIDETTMPHALVRAADGTFVFVPFSWDMRRVGDETTNPNPRFIGRSIRKVIFDQNRLILLNGENATASGAGDFGRFYRLTVLDTIDSDPLDLAAASTRVSELYDALPFNDGIMLTSDQTQFSMTWGQFGLAGETASIRPVTNYEVKWQAGMAAIGTEVYFASERNGWAILREYARDPNVDALSAAEITAHVPRLIPAGVRQLIGAGDVNALFTLTSGDPTAVFVYQFYWLDSSTKAQSAHHRWTVGDNCTVLAGVYLTGYLYLCIAREDGVYLERVNLIQSAQPAQSPIQICLDRRCIPTLAYDAGTNRTVVTLPYAPAQTWLYQLVRGSGATDRPGSLVDPATYQWTSGSTFTVPGNETGTTLFGGMKYYFRLAFSPVFYRKYYNGEAITTGRMQLRTWKVFYFNTGYFSTEVRPYNQDANTLQVVPAKVNEFTGKVVGEQDLILNQPVLHTGNYSFTVYGDARLAKIAVLNDSHVPSTFVSAAFEALYWNRAQAI